MNYRPEQSIMLDDRDAEIPFLAMDSPTRPSGPRFRGFRVSLNRKKSGKKQKVRLPLQLLPPVNEEPSESNNNNTKKKQKQKHLYNSLLNHLRTHLSFRSNSNSNSSSADNQNKDFKSNNNNNKNNNSSKDSAYDTATLPPSLLAQLIQLTKLRAAIQRAQRHPGEASYVAGTEQQFPIHMLLHLLMRYNQEQQELLDASHVNTLLTTLLIAHPVAAYQADATGLIPALQAVRHAMITTATVNLILLTNPSVLEQREPGTGQSLKEIQQEAQPNNTELATLLSQPAEMWYTARKAVASRLQQTSCIRVPSVANENGNAGNENVNNNDNDHNVNDNDNDDALTHNPFFDYAGRDDATIISATTAALMPYMPPEQTASVPESVTTATRKVTKNGDANNPDDNNEQVWPVTMEDNVFGKTTHHTTNKQQNKLQDKIRIIQQRQQQQQQERVQHMMKLIEFTLGGGDDGSNDLSMLKVQSEISKAVHEKNVHKYEQLYAEHASSDEASLDDLQTKLKRLLESESPSLLFSDNESNEMSFWEESAFTHTGDDHNDSDNSDENADADAEVASLASVYKDVNEDEQNEEVGAIGEQDNSENSGVSYNSGHQVVAEELEWPGHDSDGRDDSYDSSHGDPELFHYDDDTATYEWTERSGHDFSDHTECETNDDDLTAIIHAAAAGMAKGKDNLDLDAIGNDGDGDDDDDDSNDNYASMIPSMKSPLPTAMMTMVNDNLDAMLKFAAEQEFSDREQSERSCEQLEHLIQEVAQSARLIDNHNCIDESDMDQSVGLASYFGGPDDCWSVADAIGI